MAEDQPPPPTYKYFNLTYPHPYVAHVEINRPEKLNSFIEPYLPYLFSTTPTLSNTRPPS